MTDDYSIRRVYRVDALAQDDPQVKGGWAIDYLRPDGVQWTSAFPDGTLSWRSAEYGIDHADADTLLDLVLHEHHMQLQHIDPTFLYNTDEETARLHHLARLKTVKKQVRYLDPDNLLQQIRDHHRASLDPADHAVKRAHVGALRAHRMKEIGRG